MSEKRVTPPLLHPHACAGYGDVLGEREGGGEGGAGVRERRSDGTINSTYAVMLAMLLLRCELCSIVMDAPLHY